MIAEIILEKNMHIGLQIAATGITHFLNFNIKHTKMLNKIMIKK